MHSYTIIIVFGVIIGLYNIYFLSKKEGFLEERVVDVLLISFFSYLIVGKFFFILLNPRIYGYYNLSSVLDAGFDSFFGSIGALISSFLYIYVFRKWSLYKIADILVKGLSIIIASFFLAEFLKIYEEGIFFLFGGWFLLFFSFNFLEKSLLFGSSSTSFRVKRVNPLAFKEFHFYVFLSFLFLSLAIYTGILTPILWRIKASLYLLMFLFTIIRMIKKDETTNIFDKVKRALLAEKKNIEKEEKKIIKNDPYFQKNRDVENAEEGDEVMEDLGHREVDMKTTMYLKLKNKIDMTLALINLGKYGKCEVCGNPIEKARLRANPYATTCVSCASKNKII